MDDKPIVQRFDYAVCLYEVLWQKESCINDMLIRVHRAAVRRESIDEVAQTFL